MISLPRRGALSTLSLEIERELTEEDLVQLRFMPGNAPPPLKKISARHRRTAIMVAQGKEDIVIADALGYTTARISQLKKDDSFMDLVARYEAQIHEGMVEDEQRFQDKLRSAGEQAIDELNERLEDPERIKRISTSELRQIVTVAADRTVAPPKAIINAPTPPANITLNFGRELKPRTGIEPRTINQDGQEVNGQE